ncbi:MAG TPA: hypothetical protein IAA23_02795 [Candidatus Helicobacter avistercoris]|nr:hypothetical protein [Candidatus Helicobacter avistercoris]
MVHSSKFLSLLLFGSLSYGVTINNWKDLPIGGISQNTAGNFNYNETQAKDFVLTDNIFFQNSSASLSVRTIISGNWKANNGLIFLNDGKKLTFNKGNISFFIDSSAINTFGTDSYFQLKNKASLDINANLAITASATSDMNSVGLFGIKDSSLNITDANLNIDLSNNQGRGPILFYTEGASGVKINSGGNKAGQNIYLKGGIEVKDTSTFELNLANQNSYYEGVVSLSNQAKFTLNLSNSSATFTTYSQQTGSATLSLENNSTLNSTIIGNQTDFIMGGNSVWNMWGQNNNGAGPNANFENSISNLTINGATVNFMNNENGSNRFEQAFMKKSLTGGGTLTGAGTFAIYADVGEKATDTITFAQGSGSHTFDILYNPNTFSQALASSISTADNMIVATIQDQNTDATFSALPTVMGLTSYTTHLERVDNRNQAQWFITNITPDGQSPLAQALTTALNTPYRLFESSSQTLNLRLGDLRNYPKDHGLYFHYTIAQNSFVQDSNLTAGKDLFMSIVGGYDMNALYRGHNDFLGFGFEINLLDTTTDIFTSSTQSYGGFLYYTSIWSNRFYYDIIFKYAYSPTDVNLGSLASSTSFSAHLLNLTAEVGKKFAFTSSRDFAYAEVQGKLTSGFIFPTSLSTSDPHGTPIEAQIDFQFPLLLRSSLYFGYEWNERFRGDLKAGVFVDYSLFNGADTILKDEWSKFEKSFDMDFDVGISIISNITIEDYLRFYLELDTSFLGSYSTDVLFNAGIRWSFTDRYVPPPPPPADPNRLKVRKLRGNTVRDIPTIKKNDRSNMKHYEGSRNQIIDGYEESTSQPQYSPNYNEEENGNANRFYPRDTYTPTPSNTPVQRGYRGSSRDTYQPSSSQVPSQSQAERYYHQDSYTPTYTTQSTNGDGYRRRR